MTNPNSKLTIIYFRYAPIRRELKYYTKYESKMTQARKRNVPRVPHSLSELGDILYEYPPTQHLFVGRVIARDNSGMALLFIHPDMFDALSRCTHLQGDGTFDVGFFSC